LANPCSEKWGAMNWIMPPLFLNLLSAPRVRLALLAVANLRSEETAMPAVEVFHTHGTAAFTMGLPFVEACAGLT
jgi:hypothetical protein